MTLELIQGSPEWRAARAGSLGASQVQQALSRIKSGWGADRANIMAQLVVERLTGLPTEGFTNAAMAWGNDKEPEARAAYSFMMDVDVVQVGLVPHPAIPGTHASPDGLVGDRGLLEIKCPNSATHIETLSGGTVPGKYVTQMQWQMACTEREWCDFVSFDPRLPADMQLFVRRVERDDALIASLEADVRDFLAEVDAKIEALKSAVQQKEAA